MLCWQWNGQPFLRTLANKITHAGEICGASREAQNIKRMRGCIILILLSLDKREEEQSETRQETEMI